MTDDNLQNSFGVLWRVSVCIFFLNLFMVLKCALLSTLATPPFFCTQEKLLSFPFVLKWCVLLSLSAPPLCELKYDGGEPLSAPITRNTASPAPPHPLSLA